MDQVKEQIDGNPYEPSSSGKQRTQSSWLGLVYLLTSAIGGFSVGYLFVPIPDPGDPEGYQSGGVFMSLLSIVVALTIRFVIWFRKSPKRNS